MATKPTKKDFAAELKRLIDVTEDFNKVLDLKPPISTDFNLNLKDKKVTNSYLQHGISMLQKEIKDTAAEIEFRDTDVFKPATLKAFEDLGINPPPVAETDDGKEKAPGDKPVKKKAPKKAADKKMPATTFIGRAICDKPDASFEDLRKAADKEGYENIKDVTIRTLMADVGKIVRYLIEIGKMSA